MTAQSRNISELENASVWRLLVQYSLPSIAGMVVYSLYNIIDSLFVGRYSGSGLWGRLPFPAWRSPSPS